MSELEVKAPEYTSPDVLAESPQASAAFTQANIQKINPDLAQVLYPQDPIVVSGINSEPSPADAAEGVGHALTSAKEGMPMQCEVTSGDALGFGILLSGVNEIREHVAKPEPEGVPVPAPVQVAELEAPKPVTPSYDMPNGPFSA